MWRDLLRTKNWWQTYVIIKETANLMYGKSKARYAFNDSSLELVITLEQTPKNWAVHYALLERELPQR